MIARGPKFNQKIEKTLFSVGPYLPNAGSTFPSNRETLVPQCGKRALGD
jgi:hypothetical protein